MQCKDASDQNCLLFNRPVFCSRFVNIRAEFLFKFARSILYAFACSLWTLSLTSFPSSIGNLPWTFVFDQRPLWSSLKTQSCHEGCIELYELAPFLCKICTHCVRMLKAGCAELFFSIIVLLLIAFQPFRAKSLCRTIFSTFCRTHNSVLCFLTI